jgi:hypothetical protein
MLLWFAIEAGALKERPQLLHVVAARSGEERRSGPQTAPLWQIETGARGTDIGSGDRCHSASSATACACKRAGTVSAAPPLSGARSGAAISLLAIFSMVIPPSGITSKTPRDVMT